MPISPGSRLGPYEVVGVAGTGGMGEVYRARDTRLDRAVAIKLLPPHLAGDPQFRERFDREARAVSQHGARERAVQPDLLDDGQHVIFSVAPASALNRPTESGEGPIVVQAIGGTDRQVLVPMGLHPRVLPTGHLTYVHNGTLFAVAFDVATRTVSGDTMPLVEGIPFSSASAVAQFAVSQTGSLIYGHGVPTTTSFELISVDRSGLDQPLPLPVPVSRYQQPRLSPDKRRLVVSASGQISMWTFATETLMRVTTNETQGHFNPAWMGNSHVVYDAADTGGGGGRRIVRRSADGAGSEDVIVPAPAGYPDASGVALCRFFPAFAAPCCGGKRNVSQSLRGLAARCRMTRRVAGSNPARGANSFQQLADIRPFVGSSRCPFPSPFHAVLFGALKSTRMLAHRPSICRAASQGN